MVACMSRSMGAPLVLVALLAWWAAPTAAAKWRAQASLNYNELALPDTCVDLQETCYDDASTGACLFNPYEIRSRCPLSCRVQRCNARNGQQYRISGHATAAGTFEYLTRMTRLGYVVKGHFRMAYTSIGPGDHVAATALMLSSLGTSAYLQAPDSSSHSPLAAPEDPIVPAVLHSITHGWNVLDIAQGSHVGRAESVVGEALTAVLAGSSFEIFPAHPSRSHTTASRQEAQGPGDLTRDMVFVSTKAGIVDALVARRLLADGTIGRPDVVYEVDSAATGSPASHPMACLHPACLKHNLNASLERLQLRTVDLLYLDRVESHLRAAGTQATMERLRAAFKTLEGMREAQQIMFYGLATWECFTISADQDEYLNLEAVVALAKEVGGEQHGFRFIQVPLSLSVPEAWSAVTQHVGTANVTLLEAAKKLRVQVFSSDPLNGGNVKWLGMRGAMVEQMAGVHGGGGKVLQWVRSTPGVLSTLVHHTARGHVETNVQLAMVKPLDKLVHQTAHDRLLEVLKT